MIRERSWGPLAERARVLRSNFESEVHEALHCVTYARMLAEVA
jgi:hypothetical protein